MQFCRLRGTLNKARLAQERSDSEARPLWFSAAYELLALAVNGQPNPALPPAVPPTKVRQAVLRGVECSSQLSQQERRSLGQCTCQLFSSCTVCHVAFLARCVLVCPQHPCPMTPLTASLQRGQASTLSPLELERRLWVSLSR